MVRPVGKWQALQVLVPIVYRMADLQGPENSNVSLTQHRSANLNLKNGILISTGRRPRGVGINCLVALERVAWRNEY